MQFKKIAQKASNYGFSLFIIGRKRIYQTRPSSLSDTEKISIVLWDESEWVVQVYQAPRQRHVLDRL